MSSAAILRSVLIIFTLFSFSLLTTVQAGQKQPKKYKDWRVVCKKIPKSEKKFCGMTQIISSNDEKTTIQVTVTYPPEQKTPQAVFRLPLGMLLQPGIEFFAGEAKVSLAYSFCVQQGCIVNTKLTSKMIKSMKSASRGGIKFVTLDGKRFEAPVSFNGFTAAFNSIKK